MPMVVVMESSIGSISMTTYSTIPAANPFPVITHSASWNAPAYNETSACRGYLVSVRKAVP